MKYFLSALLFLAGLSIIAISFKMHGELQALARSPMPKLEDQMVRRIVPTYPPGSNPKPTEVASDISRRIYGIGAVGVVLVIGGLSLLAFKGKQESGAESSQ